MCSPYAVNSPTYAAGGLSNRIQPRLRPSGSWASAGRFHNVGLVCGPASKGLVVIDLDGQAAYLTFTTRFPDLADTYTVATGSGSGHHAYLFARSLPRPSRALQTPLGNVEILSTGRLVVAPTQSASRAPGGDTRSSWPPTSSRLTISTAISRWVEELRRQETPQRGEPDNFKARISEAPHHTFILADQPGAD